MSQAKGRSPWAAASIQTAKGGCERARELKQTRFLAAEAPRLPLPECPTPNECPCTYRKYPDRRAGARREEEDTGIRRPADPRKERRVKRGRRQSDYL